MTPSIMRSIGSASGASRAARIGLWAAGLLLSLLVGALLYMQAARATEDDARRRFEALARGTQARLETAIHSYTSVVHGLGALFQAGDGNVSRLQFHRYVEGLAIARHFPAIEAVSYAPYIRDAERDAFVAAVRADRSLDPAGYPRFDIRPPGRRPDYTVLTYMEPEHAMREKAGTDMSAAGPLHAQALAHARDTGEITASGQPVLIAKPTPHIALGMRLPVYRRGDLSDVAQRRAAYLGSVGIGFSVPALVEGALGDAAAQPLALALYSSGDRAGKALAIGPGDKLLYRARMVPQGGRFETVLPVDFNGTLWKAHFSAPAQDLFNDFDQRLPLLALAAGFIGTLLLYSLFLTLYWSRRGAQQERELLDMVLDNVDAYVYMKGRDRRYRYVNAKTAGALGRPADEIIGLRDRDLLPPDQADLAWEGDSDIFVDRQRRADQVGFELPDGTRHQLWRVRAPVIADGEVVAVLGVSTDVTELHELKAQADAANRAKSEFLSNMSHEIRTPMNSIIGMTHLALQAAQEPKVRDYLEKIHHSGQHLLGIINHILDFSKIEAGRMELELLDFTLDALMRNLSGQLGQAAAAKGLALEFDIDPDLSGPLRGDPLRLEQVLLNFTGNAIKFSERGSIAVRARPAGRFGPDTVVRFEVQDHGIGIDPADLPGLFKPFHQADPSTTRRYGGTGLGLVISKQLAELMGGEVGVESAPGQGSTFWFTARLGQGADPAAAPAQPGQAAGVIAGARILLVEDNVFSQQVACELLEGAGAAVAVAGNGAEALEALRRAKFDCVLMDVQMPVMDGFEATRRIRADPALRDMIVVAMTANAGVEDRVRCLAAGMNDFLTKPVVPGLLADTVARCLGRRPTVAPAAAAPAPAVPAPASSLLDLAVLAASVGGDPERMRKYAFLFLDTAREGLAEIDVALAASDLARAAGVAHRIKSSARTVGANSFGAVCDELERLPGHGSLAQARALAARLRGLHARLERNVAAELGVRATDPAR